MGLGLPRFGGYLRTLSRESFSDAQDPSRIPRRVPSAEGRSGPCRPGSNRPRSRVRARTPDHSELGRRSGSQGRSTGGQADLRGRGEWHSRKRIARLMREAGLVEACQRRGGPVTTRQDREAKPAPDLVDRVFSAVAPNRLCSPTSPMCRRLLVSSPRRGARRLQPPDRRIGRRCLPLERSPTGLNRLGFRLWL